jgi:tetratricopeptide (TPR) repeat protein
MKKTSMLAIGIMAVNPMFAQSTDSSEVYFQKGIEEKTARHYLVASKNFEKALHFNPQLKEAHLENGFVNLEMRKTDNAIAAFTKVLSLEPTNTAAAKELMDLYYNYRQFAKAREMAMKCAATPSAEKIIALCNYQTEDYGNAVKGLLNYLAKNPTDAEATYSLGRSYLEMEEYKNAIPYYTKAVTLDESKNAWMYELGLIYYNQEDFKSAIVYFNQAAAKGYPQTSDAVENMGYANIYAGDFEKGEKILMDLLAKKPGNKELLRDIAEAYYQRKMYDKSLDFCQKLMELNANDGKALYQAGLCFQKKGQTDKGQKMCDKAIEMDPSLNSLRQKSMTAGM